MNFFNLPGIDYDKLMDDEQKVLRRVLAKLPTIKNSSMNFRHMKTAVAGIMVSARPVLVREYSIFSQFSIGQLTVFLSIFYICSIFIS